jgi:hypothetical protein
MDIKVPIMKLLTHPDSEVRSQALLTLQKVMITNWYGLRWGFLLTNQGIPPRINFGCHSF